MLLHARTLGLIQAALLKKTNERAWKGQCIRRCSHGESARLGVHRVRAGENVRAVGDQTSPPRNEDKQAWKDHWWRQAYAPRRKSPKSQLSSLAKKRSESGHVSFHSRSCARISVAFLAVDVLSPFFFKSLMRMLAVDDRMNRDTTTTNDPTELAVIFVKPSALLTRALALCVSRRSERTRAALRGWHMFSLISQSLDARSGTGARLFTGWGGTRQGEASDRWSSVTTVKPVVFEALRVYRLE